MHYHTIQYCVELIEGCLVGQFPEELQPMSMDMREMYYPYNERPAMIWADTSGKIQVTFQAIEKKMTPPETASAAEAIREYTERLYPREEILPVHLYREGEIPVGWFVMKLEINREQQRHVKAVLSVYNKMCILTLTYPEPEHLKWEIVLKNMFAALHRIGEKNGICKGA